MRASKWRVNCESDGESEREMKNESSCRFKDVLPHRPEFAVLNESGRVYGVWECFDYSCFFGVAADSLEPFDWDSCCSNCNAISWASSMNDSGLRMTSSPSLKPSRMTVN